MEIPLWIWEGGVWDFWWPHRWLQRRKKYWTKRKGRAKARQCYSENFGKPHKLTLNDTGLRMYLPRINIKILNKLIVVNNWNQRNWCWIFSHLQPNALVLSKWIEMNWIRLSMILPYIVLDYMSNSSYPLYYYSLNFVFESQHCAKSNDDFWNWLL